MLTSFLRWVKSVVDFSDVYWMAMKSQLWNTTRDEYRLPIDIYFALLPHWIISRARRGTTFSIPLNGDFNDLIPPHGVDVITRTNYHVYIVQRIFYAFFWITSIQYCIFLKPIHKQYIFKILNSNFSQFGNQECLLKISKCLVLTVCWNPRGIGPMEFPWDFQSSLSLSYSIPCNETNAIVQYFQVIQMDKPNPSCQNFVTTHQTAYIHYIRL